MIYILLWCEPSIIIDLKSLVTKKKLESLHENIYVIRHPFLDPFNWSHHQKIVVIDQQIAFVGGNDFQVTLPKNQDLIFVLVDMTHVIIL
jgi:phospholipase D1/2